MARMPNVELGEAIAQWLEHRETFDETKPGTQLKDRTVLRQFQKFVYDYRHVTEIDVNALGIDHVTAWRSARNTYRQPGSLKPLAPATINSDVRAIKLFFTWTRKFGITDPATGKKFRISSVSPAEHLKVKRITGSGPSLLRLMPEEWPDLLDATTDPQVRWLMACALYSFMRAGEVRLATHGDLLPIIESDGSESPGLWITREKATQKNAPPVRDHIHQTLEFQEEYERWMKFYRKNLAAQGVFEIDPSWPLVPAYLAGPPITVQGSDGRFTTTRRLNYKKAIGRNLEQPVKACIAQLGYPTDKEGMHFLRRSGARGFFDDLTLRQAQGEILPDSPIRIVMALLGHKEQSTTEIYIGVEASRTARNTMMKGRRMIEKRVKQPEGLRAVEPVPSPQRAPEPVRRLALVRNVS